MLNHNCMRRLDLFCCPFDSPGLWRANTKVACHLKQFIIAFAALLIPISLSPLVQAVDEADPQKVFNDVYGAAVRRVQATSETADDLALATKIFESSILFVQKPQLFAVICRKVIELASIDVLGLATVKKSLAMMRQNEMTIVATDFPVELVKLSQSAYIRAKSSQRAEAGEAFINVVLEYGQFLESIGNSGLAITQYRRASSIAIAIRWPDRARLVERINAATARRVIEARIQSLEKQLKVNPADTSAGEELIYLYLIELDDSVGARKAANSMTNADIKKSATWATSDIESLNDEATSYLGSWYEKMLPRAKEAEAKTRVLTRILAVLNRYLIIHKEQDLDHLRVKVKRDRFAADLAKMKEEADSRQTMRGLVFWVDPNRNPATPLRDWVSSSKETNKGVTVAAVADTKVLAFKDRAYLDYDVPKAVSSISKTGTVLVWFASATPNVDTPLLNRTNGNATGDLGLFVRADTLTLWQNYPPDLTMLMQSKIKLTAREWHLVGHTWDEKAATLYIDGKPDQSLAIKPPPVAGSHIIIGADFPGAAEYLNGYIGSARIFNRALSAKEIAQIYVKERPVYNVSPWTDSP